MQETRIKIFVSYLFCQIFFFLLFILYLNFIYVSDDNIQLKRQENGYSNFLIITDDYNYFFFIYLKICEQMCNI